MNEDQEILEAMSGVKGLSSTDAAALILSEGRTMNPEKAAVMATGQELDMDGLQRAHLRRMMGFNFKIKIQGSKIHVYAKEGPRVSSSARIKDGELDPYGNIVSDELIKRMTDACIRLKIKWDAAILKSGARS